MDEMGGAAESIVSQMTNLSEKGIEGSFKLAGTAIGNGKSLAAFVAAIIKKKHLSKGETKLATILKSTAGAKVYAVNSNRFLEFSEEAKRMGLSFAAIKDSNNLGRNDDSVNIFVKGEDASIMNFLINKLQLDKVEPEAEYKLDFDSEQTKKAFDDSISKETVSSEQSVPAEEISNIDENMTAFDGDDNNIANIIFESSIEMTEEKKPDEIANAKGITENDFADVSGFEKESNPILASAERTSDSSTATPSQQSPSEAVSKKSKAPEISDKVEKSYDLNEFFKLAIQRSYSNIDIDDDVPGEKKSIKVRIAEKKADNIAKKVSENIEKTSEKAAEKVEKAAENLGKNVGAAR